MIKTKTLLSLLIVGLAYSAHSQEILSGEFYTGGNSGWYKLATIDLADVGGCCGHANVEVEFNYATTTYSYNVNATLWFRINKNNGDDKASWRYNIDGKQGEMVKLKKLSSHLYELWGHSPRAYGYFLTELRVAKAGTVGINIYNSPIEVTDTGQQDVESWGDWYFPNGNVNIGHSDNISGHKLSVAGSGIFEEVNVKLKTQWPDYVFLPEYNLTSLSDLESYLKENHHLPGIPTAKEVQDDGVALGEMNAKLLEKVEELTLHIIELEKRIKELEK